MIHFLLQRSTVLATLCVLLSLLTTSLTAQINDCADAQVVCDDGHIQFNPDGPGFDDFLDPDNDAGCIVDHEQNSAWFYFEIDPLAPPNLVLGFIINPDGGFGEDYDWALYGPDVDCGDLGSPIRCSSSSAACDFCPQTGMGMGTTDFSEGPGTGDGFVSTLIVQPGQGFYLMIDNWLGTSNGFTLEWTDSAAPYLNCDAQPPCALVSLAGPDLEACEGDDSGFQLSGDSQGSDGAETYEWSGTNGGTSFLDDPFSPNPVVTLPDGFTGVVVYTLTVTEDTCIGVDQMELTVHPLPVINIIQIGPFCANVGPQTLVATPFFGVWSGDNTGNTFNPSTHGPGIYTVTYTYEDNNDCVNSASMDIEVYELPEASIEPDPAEFCDSDGSILLTAFGSGGEPGYTYHWNSPSGTGDDNTYEATLAGQHYVTVTDENGCTDTTSILVVTHANPDLVIEDPGPLCTSMDFYQLSATPFGGEFDGSIINSDGEIYPEAHSPGTYSVSYTYTDEHNCTSTEFQTITILSTPNAVASNNTPLCEGQQIQLTGLTDSTGANFSYLWTGPGGYVSMVQNPIDATLAGPYLLQVVNGQCASVADTTYVILSPQPDALATNNGPYCNGEPILLFGNTTASGTEIYYEWTGPNGFVSNLQNPTNATNQGTYSLLVTVDGCLSDTATTIVIFSTPPDASATNNGPYCSYETVELFGNTTSSGVTVQYTWTGPNGFTSADQNPSGTFAAGSYQLIVNVDGCNSPPTVTNVVVNAAPQPVITGPNTFCTGNTVTLDAGGGFMSYIWGDNSTNQTLDVSASGLYQVTVTDGNSCTGMASLAVSEIPSLMPIITGALEFCEGGSSTLDAGTGYTSYAWSTGDTTQTIPVNSSGNFGVVVTDATGCDGSTNATVTEHPNPVVMIGGSTTYCIGGSTTLDAGPGYSIYNWSNGPTTQTITVSSPGTYSVDVIDVHGCPGSGSVTVFEDISLHPVITGGTAFCESGSTILNAGSGFATYLWSDNSTDQNLEVFAAGTYSVTVSDGQGCSGESSVAVIEVPPPVAVVEPGAQLCNTTAGGSVINLYDLILSGDASGSWQDVDNSGAVGLFTSLDFANVTAGDYLFTYTTNSAVAPCPESVYNVVITVLECTCPDVLFHTPSPLCNESDVLDLSTLENTSETGIWSITQTPPGTNPAVLIGKNFNSTGSDTGQYIVQFSLQNLPPPGCPSDFEVTLQVDQKVDAGAAALPLDYCHQENDQVILADQLNGEDNLGTWIETSSVPSQGGAFNPTNGTFITDNQSPGNYTFQYDLPANGACPADFAVVTVDINPLPTVVVKPADELDCSHETQTLDASGSSSGSQYDIEWTGPGIVFNGNESTLQPTVDKPGNYTLTIINNQTGCIDSASVTVVQNIDTPTDALINSQGPGCFGAADGFIEVGQVFGGTPPYASILNNGTLNASNYFDNLAAGDYDLIVQDANGCRWDTAITLVAPGQIILDAGPDIEVELGEAATVQASINIPLSDVDTLIWSPDDIIECIDVLCLEATVNTFHSVTLEALVIDVNGCQAVDEIIIKVTTHRKIFIPTLFSPNGDGNNDIFYIAGSDRQINQIKKFLVYNRWGELMHEANDFPPNDPAYGWDGKFKSEDLNPGVFVYVFEIEYVDGISEVVTGDVTIMR